MNFPVKVDEELLALAMEACGVRQRREVVEMGLVALVRLRREERLARLAGASTTGGTGGATPLLRLRGSGGG